MDRPLKFVSQLSHPDTSSAAAAANPEVGAITAAFAALSVDPIPAISVATFARAAGAATTYDTLSSNWHAQERNSGARPALRVWPKRPIRMNSLSVLMVWIGVHECRVKFLDDVG